MIPSTMGDLPLTVNAIRHALRRAHEAGELAVIREEGGR